MHTLGLTKQGKEICLCLVLLCLVLGSVGVEPHTSKSINDKQPNSLSMLPYKYSRHTKNNLGNLLSLHIRLLDIFIMWRINKVAPYKAGVCIQCSKSYRGSLLMHLVKLVHICIQQTKGYQGSLLTLVWQLIDG